MKENDTLRETRIDLDRGIDGVMPDSWEGHARLAIRQSEAVPENIEEKAISKVSKLVNERDAKPEKIANSLISQIADKLD